jgi:hypothetical protein
MYECIRLEGDELFVTFHSACENNVATVALEQVVVCGFSTLEYWIFLCMKVKLSTSPFPPCDKAVGNVVDMNCCQVD